MVQAAGTPPTLPATALALLAGAVACLAAPVVPGWPWACAVAMAGVLAWWRGCTAVQLAGVAVLGFSLAALHAGWALSRQLPAAYEGGDAVLAGRVVDLPEHGSRRTRFMFRVDRGGGIPPHLRGRLLRLAWYDPWGAEAGAARPRHRLEAGSRWRLHVRLRGPRGLRNPGGSDGEKHALARRVAAAGYVRQPEAAQGIGPPQGLHAWRAATSARIGASVAAPAGRFVRALALGDTRGLDDHDWEVLRGNGLTHLVAISGFHVGLVAGFMALLASAAWWLLPGLATRVPRLQAAACAAFAGALGYAAVAGFALPTVRTVLMVAVVVGARLARRAHGGFDGLSLAAIAMVLVDPLSLLGAGFWLSFAGVAWLLWCLPEAHRNPLRGLLGAQGVASIGLLPLSVVLFDQASLAGPAANLVAVPWWSLVVVPLSLAGTGLEALQPGAGGWAWRLAADAFDLAWPLFERLHGTGLALWWLPEAHWIALPLALLGAFWLLLPRGTPGKALALLLWLPLLWPARDLPAPGEVELQVLDVGQGLSVLVRTHRHALLYDMGPAVEEGYDAGDRVVVPALHALAVRRLDAMVVSHGDLDHAGGLAAVRRTFEPPIAWAPEGSPVPGNRNCLAGADWEWDGVRFRFLHPRSAFPYFGNEASCVLRIESVHGAALLPGDIGAAVERMLLHHDAGSVRADVVVVAHHGSRTSSDPRFVEATGARHALVAAGSGGRFEHPHPEVVARWERAGARVANTATAGALRVRIADGGILVDGRRTLDRRLWDAVRRERPGAGLSYRPD